MAKYDIIIPVYNQGEMTRRCLESVKAHSKDYRILLIDNGSDPEEWAMIVHRLAPMPYGDLGIRLPENIGFVKAVNIALGHSTAPYIVLLNNDVEVAADWLDKLEEPFHYRYGKVGAVGCLSTSSTTPRPKPEHRRGYEVLHDGDFLPFFCVMLSREAIEKTGLLNEAFGIGLHDDTEYCRRLQANGFKLARTLDLTVYHKGQATFKELYTPEEINEMIRKNALILEGKEEKENDTNLQDGNSSSPAED
jgi:hypothetical protein